MPLYMLDTNHVGYLARGSSAAARAKVDALRREDRLCVSVITEAEILFGLAKQPNATALRSAMESFLLKVEVLPWRREEAAIYGALRARQDALGRRLEPMDMLIAAHAVTVGAVLVSRDRAFADVPDLHGLENWVTDMK